MIDREQAWAIAREFAQEVGARWNTDVLAVLLIGSLATGAYRPGRSDIDTVVILRTGATGSIDAELNQLRDHYQATYAIPKGFGAVILREPEIRPPYLEIDIVPEILRVIEQGQLLWGDINRSVIPRPSNEVISAYIHKFTEWLRTYYIDQRPADARTIDATVNTILYELRCWLWQETRIYVLDKGEVVQRARTLKGASHFAEIWVKLERYLNAGNGFADIEVAEQTLQDLSSFVRKRSNI
jgi:predicted nucleotidyltransferase